MLGASAPFIRVRHASRARFDPRGVCIDVDVVATEGSATEREREISADDGDGAKMGRDGVDERRRGRWERETREDEGGARTERDEGKVG